MGRRTLSQIAAGMALACLLTGAWWQAPDPVDSVRAEEGGEGPEASGGEGCMPLAGLEPVVVYVRPDGGAVERVGTGYRDPVGSRILVPARRVVGPLAPGPLGVHWEERSRTATMLREGSVLSIHFPADRNWSAVAILNGEAVGADSLLCGGRLYAPLRLLADGLNLRFRWRDGRSILVEGG